MKHKIGSVRQRRVLYAYDCPFGPGVVISRLGWDFFLSARGPPRPDFFLPSVLAFSFEEVIQTYLYVHMPDLNSNCLSPKMLFMLDYPLSELNKY